MTITNPHQLPKIRSKILRRSALDLPCCLRISSFVPGHKCSAPDTNVMCHLPVFGKGFNTKVSDMFMACGCGNCHDLIDARDARVHAILEQYPAAFYDRLLKGYCETLNRWHMADIIQFPNEGIK